MSAVRVRRSVEALERIWRTLPIEHVWFWGQAGVLPDLADEMDAREAQRADES